ncbi:MAG: hypothetical protein NTX64_11385 [Elusimicrobia bacterium]|nr:hypothetical protein [Elusimicrobiota bacterium]
MTDPVLRLEEDSEPDEERVEPSSRRKRPILLFDARDYELVELIAEFRTVGKRERPEMLRSLFDPALHPRGIKELTATRERRLAYAAIRLLDSLEQDDANDRLVALRALHDEAFLSSAGGLQRNTARVLLTVMKELVREERDYWRQVDLAHDFYRAVSGRPAEIRRQLRKYHLIEMSEEWNQVAFDHHVHDAHTKGRKAPTHLVLDAWIKGIRDLTVVYYYYWTPDAVAELKEAAEIMDVNVRPGLEFSARSHGKYIHFIWVPRGLDSARDFRAFVEKGSTKAFMDLGREVARRSAEYVFTVLRCFNQKYLSALNEHFDIHLAPLIEDEFRASIGVGQASITHLADFIHHKCLESARPLVADLARRARRAQGAEKSHFEDRLRELDHLLPHVIAESWLRRSCYPEVPHPDDLREGEDVPDLLKLTTRELCERLNGVRSGCDLVLNLTDLTPADVLEALYQSHGAVTHLELFNLKDYRLQKAPDVRAIAHIRQVLNSGNTIILKRLIGDCIREIAAGNGPHKEERIRGLEHALAHLAEFGSLYAKVPLRTTIGSDSMGRAQSLFGMGLVVAETLPARARREYFRARGTREVLPLRTETEHHIVVRERPNPFFAMAWTFRILRKLPGMSELGTNRRESFELVPNTTHVEQPGNILTMGGIEKDPTNGFLLGPPSQAPPPFARTRLKSRIRNLGKVLVGLVPAFLTFYLTKDWWVLAWLGAPIWFGITGLRNVLQSVVGGGGFARSKLISWKDLVSWERVADSLLYTGFSVPLLDWLVKSVLLKQSLDITVANAPLLCYSVLGLANGIYLFSHNTIRGLPQAAARGNFFRSVLAIPVAFALNAVVRFLMIKGGMTAPAADAMMQNWAAVISKAASDLVAGFIEGSADRGVNIRMRLLDYGTKVRWLLFRHGELEALLPKHDVLQLLQSPKEFINLVAGERGDDEVRHQILNSLDLLYFWMLQPRARPVFRRMMEESTPDERRIVFHTQRLLERQKLISKLLLDGLAGRNFGPALAFYLDKSPIYLRDMARLAAEIESTTRSAS